MDKYQEKLLKSLEADLGVSVEEVRRRRAEASASESMWPFWYGNEPGYKEELEAIAKDEYHNNPNHQVFYEKEGIIYKINLLDLSLNSVPNSVTSFEKLEILEMSSNNINKIPEKIRDLRQLRKLNLNSNQLSDIKALAGLPQLEGLSLNNNQITEIPEQLVLLEHLKEIEIEGNPVETPPYDICLGGLDGIRSWYQSAGKIYQDTQGRWRLVEDQKSSVDMVPLHEIKMILIGNGNVGKTSLTLRLMDRTASLPTQQERTHGLANYRWEKSIQIPGSRVPRSFRFNIWDFGGQGKFRAVQQLFCSRKSLYLYVTSPDDKVINSQENYRDFGYWLAMVRAYSFDPEASQASPVIHVSNKQDLGATPVNEKDMHEIYPDLHPGTVRTSALTNEGVDTLETILETVLPKVSFDVFTSTYSWRWLKVKETLEERQEAYISFAEYKEIASTHNLNDLETNQWLRVLQRLGTVIYFDAVSELRNTVFLKPEWVREAAYGILRSKAIEKWYGKFHEEDFPLIWGNYTAEEHQKLIALMRAFELCYITKDDFGRPLYIAPALFPAQPPKNYRFSLLSSPNYTTFELRFLFQSFLPAGLLHRLIVRLHDLLYRSYSWRKGAVLHDKDTYAEITEDWEDKQLSVKLMGPAPQELFNSIKEEVEQIIDDLKNNKMLHHLTTISEGRYKEEWWELDKLKKLSIDFWRQKVPSVGVNLFISYAREDEPYKKELVKHMSGLRQKGTIRDWNDQQIIPGQAWNPEIKEKLESSQVVLFLVSADFMFSDYIQDVEIARTIERHKNGQVTIIPILIRPCDFSSLKISSHQALPSAPGEGLKPVSEWSNNSQHPWKSDNVWMNIVNELKRLLAVESNSE